MITLGTKSWGSAPTIPITFSYEKFRSGASMGYKWQVSVASVSGASYYGYPIYLQVTLGGTLRESVTLKAASPSTWTSAIVYTSGTFYVDNKTTGTTPIAFRVYSGLGSSRDSTYSYSLAVDPAASELTVSNGTLGTAQTLSVKKYDTSFTHTIEYACGTAYGTICTKSSSTSLSWAPPLSLASQNTTGTSVSVELSIITYSGESVVSSNQYTIICSIPDSVKPTIGLSFVDTSGCLNKYGKYVQGKSVLDVTVSPVEAYGSEIQSCVVEFDGKTYTGKEFTTSAVKNHGNLTMAVTVKDARGRTGEYSTALSVYEYIPPRVTDLVVRRCKSNSVSNPAGAYLAVDFSTIITSLGGKNSANYTLKYKKTTESTYTEDALTSLDGAYVLSGMSSVFSADTLSSYDVVIVAEDDFASVTKKGTGSSVKKFWSWLSNGLGIAFGKIAEFENLFDVAFDARFRGAVRFDEPYFYTDDGVQEWHTPPMGFGVEYRTTERFHGLPVYARLIEFNTVPGNEIYFEPGFYFTSGLVRVTGRFYNSAETNVYVVPSDEISFQYTPNGYCIKGNTIDITGYSGSVAFYYVH